MQAKDYKNSINDPLVFGDDSDIFIRHISPPELPLMLRITNKIFNEMEKLSSTASKIAYSYYEKLGIARPKMHGGEFNGNMCERLLRNLDFLEDFIRVRNEDRLIPFVQCLKLLNEVRISCFGHVLSGNFVNNIKDFQKAYLKLGISVTTAVHTLFVHVRQFC